MDNRLLTRRRLQAGVIAIAALCAQYTSVIMMPQSTSSPKAQWNEQEVTALLEYLHGHKAEAGDGGSFKMSTLNGAATHIQQHLTQGPVKTGKMCKTKWTAVRPPRHSSSSALISSGAAEECIYNHRYLQQSIGSSLG
jgi:hypothetical protein